MGVNGLWRLIEPSGKPVPVETLENQVLAVDVSIWLHQVTKGFQDASGNALPNAHLLGLFHRLCKLLFYKIRPVFVFDGGIPHLKKQTVIARRQQKGKAEQVAERMREKLLQNLIKHNAVKNMLGVQAWQSEISMPRVRTEDDMFQLPPPTQNEEKSDSGSESDDVAPVKYNDLHTLDVKSAHFRSLPADMRHDILVELKETRKQSSWGRLHEIPKESNEFSNYQMKRLLKRRSVQVSLEEAEKEMGGKTLSLGELEELMADHGIVTDSEIGKRIASDSTTRFIFINGSKVESTIRKDDKDEQTNNQSNTSTNEDAVECNKASSPIAIKEDELFHCDDYEDYDVIDESEWNEKFADEEDFDEEISKNLSVAKNFMFENSGLTQSQILAIIKTQNKSKKGGNKHPIPSSSNENHHGDRTVTKNLHHNSTDKCEEDVILISDKGKSPPVSLPSTSRTNYEESHLSNTVTRLQNPHVSDAINKTKNVLKEVQDLLISIKKASCAISTSSTKNNLVESTSQNESDSESDAGFVEVEEESLSASESIVPEAKETVNAPSKIVGKVGSTDVVLNTKNKENSNTLEVVIQPSKLDMEDDIFADIFSESSDKVQRSDKISNLDHIENNQVQNEVSSCIENDVLKNVSLENNQNNTSIKIVNSESNIESKNHIENNKLSIESQHVICEKISSESEVRNLAKCNESVQLELKSTIGIESPEKKTDNTENNSICNVEIRQGNAIKPKETENITSSPQIDKVNSNSSSYNTDSQNTNEMNNQKKHLDKIELPKAVLDSESAEKLQKLQSSIEEEHFRLMVEKGKQDRLAASITDQMYSEAQELLELFGVPYIVAPMEAEAQCAYLDAVSLTDGTITDDSDIWLFGGQEVYKNFFNQKKHVMKFRSADIQHYFKLSRQEMILLALLVGSDYTVGLQGIGPVTALEILATFSPQSSDEQEDEIEALANCLQDFRSWWATGKSAGPVKVSLRNKIKDLKIHPGFPSNAVIEAYLRPKVDDSRETFSWSNPDLVALRKYAAEKFGWAQTKTDSILLPVMKKLNERTNQQTLDSFVRIKPKLPLPEGRVSKRVHSAIKRMGGENDSNSDSEEGPGPAPSKLQKIRKVMNKALRSRGRISRGRGGRGGHASCELNNEPTGTISRESNQRGRGRGRGGHASCDLNNELPGTISRERSQRGRGRGRGRGVRELERSGLNYEPEENAPKTEFILQREKDKLNSLNNKLKAIEIYRKSKHGLDRTKRDKKVRKTIAAPNLSDSSDSD